MSGRVRRGDVILGACLALGAPSLLACRGGAKTSSKTSFSAGGDFSKSANPNGPWRFGYTHAGTLARSEFMPDTFANEKGVVGFWHPGRDAAGYFPYIAAGLTASVAVFRSAKDPTSAWAVRPGELALEASNDGQLAVVEFTVPRAGSYEIVADFAGIHTHLSSTDVHVRLGDEALFDGIIEGYGGDPGFFPRQGESPTASYRATRRLAAGDVLFFAVGFGNNHTHFNDTTGLTVTIRAAD